MVGAKEEWDGSEKYSCKEADKTKWEKIEEVRKFFTKND